VWLITNTSGTIIEHPSARIVAGLPSGVTVDAREKTTTGKPYYRVFLPDGALTPARRSRSPSSGPAAGRAARTRFN